MWHARSKSVGATWFLSFDLSGLFLRCSLLGLAFGRTKKVKKKQSSPSLDDKQRYLDEGRQFAEELAKELANEEGKK